MSLQHEETNTETKNYINQLNEIELNILKLAQDTLKTSFSIEKSIGFLQWKEKNREKNIENTENTEKKEKI